MIAADPAREKVERADAVLKETQEQVIDDPTVFVKGAALGALTLSELARVAQSRSQGPMVLTYAQALRRNQDAFRRELGAVAGRKRLDVPTSLIYQDEQMLAEGKGKPAAEFDAWFALQANAELLKSIGLFEAAARMKDPELAALARKSLAGLEADRKGAIDLYRP